MRGENLAFDQRREGLCGFFWQRKAWIEFNNAFYADTGIHNHRFVDFAHKLTCLSSKPFSTEYLERLEAAKRLDKRKK